MSVVIYSTTYCPFCDRAKELLTSLGAAYENIDVQENPDRRMEMVEKAGGLRTVPQIFINDEHIGGYDQLAALHAEGGLEPKLK